MLSYLAVLANTGKQHFLTAILLVSCSIVSAQHLDSVQVSVGMVGTVATHDFQPLWLVSNRFGTIADRSSDLTTQLSIKNRQTFGITSDRQNNEKKVYLDYGIALFNNEHLRHTTILEGYAKTGYKNWEIRAGRFKEVVGEVDQDLSSGSLGVSGNALPIPQVGVAVTEFTKVPFTKGWLQFKGQLTHGWMGQNQYLKDAFLHQKTFYMRLGKKRLKLFGGVQHFAVWGGGRHDWLQLDRDWKGFLDVLLVKEADDGSLLNGTVRDGTVPDGTYIMRPNRAGDHRGVVDGGFEWEGDKILIKAYHQTPFDMGIGISFRNIDKLAGLSITNKNKTSFFNKVLIEAIHTKQMTDWMPRHRESYYNNGIYKTGWEYEDQIIGTPLFTNRLRANKYFPDITPLDWNAPYNKIPGNKNILNNKIIGGHIGILLTPISRVTTRSMITYSRNYSSFERKKPLPYYRQLYGLQEFLYQSPVPNLKFIGSVGIDYGQLSKNYGLMLGLEWRLNPFIK